MRTTHHEMEHDGARLRSTSLLAGPRTCVECLTEDVPALCSQGRCKPCHVICQTCWPAHRAEMAQGRFQSVEGGAHAKD